MMNPVEEKALLAEIIEKLKNLHTPSKAFSTRKLINSTRPESFSQYVQNL